MKKIYNNFLKNCFFIYTCAFLIVSLTIFLTFYKSDVGFVCYGDGVKQHIVTLSYFRSILINFIKTGNFSTFTLELANGMDMYSNLAFYTFGDFINYFSIFFKHDQLNFFYSLAIFIRIYLIGCSFCFYSKCKNQKTIPTIIGALMYAFSGLVLNQLVHPFFLTPLIIFPLLMLSIERFILSNQKKYFPILVAITILTNFYFAYSSLLIVAIYGSILIIINFKGKERFLKFGNIIAYGFLGILISAVIILPSLYSLINSPRIADFNKLPYRLSYYKDFLKTFISTSTNYYTLNIGLSSIILITIPIFISKIKNKDFKPYVLVFLIMLLPLLSFKIGIIFSAFQFAKHRWTYTLLFILCYATTMVLSEKNNIKISNLIAVIFLYLTSFLIFDIKIDKQLFVSILLIIPFVYYYFTKNNKLILIFVILNLTLNSYYHYSSAGNNNISNFNYFNKAYTYFENPTSLRESIEYIKRKDKSYYNIQTNNSKIYNAGLLYKFNTQNYYYSVTSKKLSELSNDLANSNYEINKEIGNFDFRTKINSLLSNKYIITDKNITIPYGYNLISNKENSIYINKYYTQYVKYYNTCISTEEYQKLSPLEKENILLKTSILDDCQNISYNKIETAKKEVSEIPFDIEKTTNTSIVINIPKKLKNKEVYVYFKNLDYNPLSKKDLINSTSTRKINELKNKYKWYSKSYNFELNVKTSKIDKTLKIDDKYYSEYYYSFPNGILINLGYYSEYNDKITINFNNKGEYTYDELKIFANDFSNYNEDIKKLNNVKTSDFKIKNNIISFNIESKDSGIVMTNTSFQKGFKLYIDNKQENIITVNNYFMGFNIESGKHKIELKYRTPYLKEGIIISTISTCLYLIIIVFNKRKNINH